MTTEGLRTVTIERLRTVTSERLRTVTIEEVRTVTMGSFSLSYLPVLSPVVDHGGDESHHIAPLFLGPLSHSLSPFTLSLTFTPST